VLDACCAAGHAQARVARRKTRPVRLGQGLTGRVQDVLLKLPRGRALDQVDDSLELVHGERLAADHLEQLLWLP